VKRLGNRDLSSPESPGLTRRDLLQGLALAHAASFAALAQTPPAPPAAAVDSDPLRQLRTTHPRLILLDADFDRIRLLVRENATAKRLYADLEKECDRLLSIPPVEYKLVGPRLQVQTRRAIARISSLALMYRLSGRDPWLRRAMLEMNAAAAFKDWNPARSIDTAEMTHAFAIGYDWLFNALTPEERATIRDAIVSKGLDAVLPIYAKPGAWKNDRLHWNLVCNGAFGLAALAIAGDTTEKETADKLGVITRAIIESVPHGLQAYGTEGGWPEGPANGEYAMRYACLLFSGLDTAVGSESLSAARGFDRAGRFRVYMTGPANRIFNFGGTPDDPGTAPELFWMSKRFHDPVLAWSEQKQIERSQHTSDRTETSVPNALDLAWFDRDAKPPQTPAWPLDAVFHSVQVASFRSSWDDPNGIFLAVKGGDNKSGRFHFDLGSFVLDAAGARWALDPDLGDVPSPPAPPPTTNPAPGIGRNPAGPVTQSQSSVPGPGGQGPPPSGPNAWITRTESHNTLLIDGGNQDPRAEAAIVHQEFGPDMTWVQIDLGKANGPKLRQWTRRAGLVGQRQAVLIQDVVRSPQPVEIVWGMVTDSEISLNGPSATLKKGQANLALEIRTPRHAVFDTVNAGPSLRKLIVRLGDKTADVDLSILMTPYRDGQTRPKITAQFPDLAPVAPAAR